MKDTVRFFAQPGVAIIWVIASGPTNAFPPKSLDTLVIQANESSKSVSSLIFDTFGNFVRYDKVSRWVSLDTSIVNVQKGDTSFGEWIVNRNPSATDSITKIYAVDTNGAVSDTLVMKLLRYFYTEYRLRIIIGNDTNPAILTMNTNHDITLSVQGKRSDTSVWVDVSAVWQSSANLKIDPPAPTGNSWHFSPSDTGHGWISVSIGGMFSDTLPVHIVNNTSIRPSKNLLPPDHWSITTSGSVSRLHIPLRGTHLINVYSLSGSIIYSSRTFSTDAQIILPKGVYIVSVRTIGSMEQFTTKIITQ